MTTVASVRRRPPRVPYDLFDAPELACVDALRSVLEIAVAAVLAANPELLTEEPLERRDDLPAEVWIADAIVADARTLRAALDRYRAALDAREREPERPDDDDIPF